jgi:hypothetical protein
VSAGAAQIAGQGGVTVRGSLGQARVTIASRLEERRPEIEQATLDRVYGVSEPAETADPEYVHGLRAAVAAALDHGLAALRRSEERSPPIPALLLVQARLAARVGVSLDTVLRRYFAGYSLLGDFLVQEAERGDEVDRADLQRLLRAQATLFDRLLAAVGEEYGRERAGQLRSTEQRRADRVKRLLAGELLDTAELAYEFDGHHVGVIASGGEAAKVLRDLTRTSELRFLLVRSSEGAVWAWWGSRSEIDRDELEAAFSRRLSAGVALAIGEPGEGLSGWRMTHRQAKAALPIALHGAGEPVRYADVALLASMLRDDLLVSSLRELYMVPLEDDRDGGVAARETLRAYLRAELNVSSAAAALGVTRQTVTSRLRAIEERWGRPLNDCTTEIDAVLRLEELGYSVFPGRSMSGPA